MSFPDLYFFLITFSSFNRTRFLHRFLAAANVLILSANTNQYFCLDIFQIISDLMHFKGSHKPEFDSRWKSFNLVKKSMENRVRNKTIYCAFVNFFVLLLYQKGLNTHTLFQTEQLCGCLFAASWQEAAHPSPANRQSHAPARGKFRIEKLTYTIFLFFQHFNSKTCLINQLRKLTVEGCQYRSIHQELMKDLLRLSTSTYSQVSSTGHSTMYYLHHIQAFINAQGSFVFN